MRAAAYQRRSLLSGLVFGLAVLVVGVLGTVGTLWALGKMELSFLTRAVLPPKGMVKVPTSGRAIPAYTKITKDHLLDPNTGGWSSTYITPEVATEVLAERKLILGRVLNHDKPAGYVFTEKDFYPKGTHPGMVAGIPPGKRALTLEADKIRGVRSLDAGDHFDVLGTISFDQKNLLSGGSFANLVMTPSTIPNPPKGATVKVLVQNGVVVSPVTTREVPVTSTSLTNGSMTRMKPVQEVVLAVEPKEIALLTEALALNAEIMCVARSGRPDDPPASITPGLPMPKRKVVETLIGKDRHLFVFPAAAGEPEDVTPPAETPAPPESAAAAGTVAAPGTP